MRFMPQNFLLLLVITSFVFSQETLIPSDTCINKAVSSPCVDIVHNDTKCKTHYLNPTISKHKSKKTWNHLYKHKLVQYSDSKKSFLLQYQGLIGAFFGSLIVALIAIGSIRKTHKNATELFNKEKLHERERNERLYCGLLFIIAQELDSNGRTSKLLLKDINTYQNFIVKYEDLPSIDPFDKYSYDFLQDVVINILKFDMYDTSIIGLMSPYILLLKRVNHDLVLSRLTESDTSKKKSNYFNAVKEYLDVVKKEIRNIGKASKNLRIAIKDEIGKFPHSKIEL